LIGASGRMVLAEFLGSALLLVAIVGSGITASTDEAGAIGLFGHAITIGAALAALVAVFGPVSGAHFNPSVTAASAARGNLPLGLAARYLAVQLAGAITGVSLANWLFGRPVLALSSTVRGGIQHAASEALVTFGLVLVILGAVRSVPKMLPAIVGCYLAAAIMFSPSAAFANPAATLGRMWSDTFAGISPQGVPAFLAGQLVGTGLAILVGARLFPDVAVARQERLHMSEVPTVLLLCVHNAGRSQMAAGWLRHLAGDRVTVLSGGSAPAEHVNPAAVKVMAEVGIDISDEYPKPWTEETFGAADVVVTMGCGDACPVVLGKKYFDWELDDPTGKPLEQVRIVRDEIEARVRWLISALGLSTLG